MVNRQLRVDLLDKLKITRQALSYRAKRLKLAYGPMSTEEAIYVIAHKEGLDISKYLPPVTIDRVRSILQRDTSIRSARQEVSNSKKNSKVSTIKPYPLISISANRQAIVMGAEVYPLMFQLENSIRLLIERVLSKSGNDWWIKRVPQDVQSNVQRTMNKEKRYTYRSQRSNDPLYYANFDDLKKIIIEPSNRVDFQGIIKDIEWFKVKMDEVYMARNNLAHCVPLSKDDISRILLFHSDWERILESAGIK
jgi:hypothetical protein